MAGDEDVGDSVGQLVVDAATVRERAKRLEKRDLMHLLSAHSAIFGIQGDLPPSNKQLATRIAGIPFQPAPSNIKSLATSRSGKSVYSLHRLCSSRVHAGAVLGRTNPYVEGESLCRQFDYVAHMLAAWAEASLNVLDAPG